MNKIFYNIDVDILLFSDAILAIVATILLINSVILIKRFDFNSFSEYQYSLEKRGYFIVVATNFLWSFKLFLFLFFVYTIDELSTIIPGAMCGAGVIYENSYGIILLGIRLVTLFFLTLFLALNHFDLKAKNYPYFKLKMWVISISSILVLAELVLDVSYFSAINLQEVVSCCSGLYGNFEGQNPLPFNLNLKMLLALFNLTLIIAIIAMYANSFVSIISFILFFYLAYYSVVYFFGLYIYELPTHKCPFCMLQKEYNYIGYFLWLSLIFGVFVGLISNVFTLLKIDSSKLKIVSILLLTIFIIICYYYVISYYLKNGVFL